MKRCKLTAKEYKKKNIAEASYYCAKCKRRANKKSKLCKPKK